MATFLIFILLSYINCYFRAEELEYPFGIDISGDGGVEKRIIEPAKTNQCDHTPQNLSYVTVNYKLVLPPNATIIEEAEGFEFQIGIGNVICCWDLALLSMAKGEKALIRCEPEYAYDDVPKNQSGLDPGTILDFEVEMISWTKPKKPKKTPNTSGRVECSDVYEGNNNTFSSSDDSKDYAMDNGDMIDGNTLHIHGHEILVGEKQLRLVILYISIGMFVCVFGAFILGYCYNNHCKGICGDKEERGIHIQISKEDMEENNMDIHEL